MTSPTDIAWTELVHNAHGGMQSLAASCAGESAALDDTTELKITDNMTADCQIGIAELEAIETYLADVLDMVLAGDKDGGSTMLCHKRMR